MSQFNTAATMNGVLKTQWAKDIINLTPESAILQTKIPFSKAPLMGDKFEVPVCLSSEQGFSFGGTGATAYTLNNSVAMTILPALITPSEMTLQSSLSYGLVSRSASKGAQAVESATKILMERMKGSAHNRLESLFLYGGKGFGKVSAHSGSSTTRTYTISDATWAAGLWSGMENAQFDFYNGSSQLNTNAAVVLTSVSVANKQITVSGNSTDLTAIDGATLPDVFYYGAYGNEMLGFDYLITQSGTVLNIDNAANNLWAGNTYDCSSAALTMAKVLAGTGIAVGRGLSEGVMLIVNPQTYQNLNSDLSALRQLDGSYSKKKGENGVDSIVYYGGSGVSIEVISHAKCKAGEAFLVPPDQVQRVGSTDLTFKLSGPAGDEQFIFDDPTHNGWTSRMYSDQGIIILAPSQCVKFTNIVNT